MDHDKKRFIIYSIGILILGFLTFIFLPSFVNAQTLFEDDFDSYSTGVLNGQGTWTTSPVSASSAGVTNSFSQSSPNSVTQNPSIKDGHSKNDFTSNPREDTYISFFYFADSSKYNTTGEDCAFYTTISLTTEAESHDITQQARICRGGTNTLNLVIGNALEVENPSFNTWNYLEVNTRKVGGANNDEVRYRTSTTGEFSAWINIGEEFNNTNVDEILLSYNWNGVVFDQDFMYIDDVAVTNGPRSFDTSTETRIIITSPAQGSTTGSQTFDIVFDYYLNSSDFDSNLWEDFIIQTCTLIYTQAGDNCEKTPAIETIVLDTLVTGVTVEVTTTRQGQHLATVNFWNGIEQSTECSWWNIFCNEMEVNLGAGDSVSFIVETNMVEADVPSWLTEGDFCSDFDDSLFTGSLCNAFMFMFIPSENSITNFLSIQDNLAQKIPFGIFFLMKQNLEEIKAGIADESDGATVTVNLGEDSIGTLTLFSWENARTSFDNFGLNNSEIVTPLRYLIWIAFSFQIIRRVYQTLGKEAPDNMRT